MARKISESPRLIVSSAILPFVLALPDTAAAQEWDLGAIPDVVIECYAESEDAGSLAPDSSLDGSWLQVRRDRKLTGRSPLIGGITCPQVLWKYDVAQTRKTLFSVNPASSSSQIALPTVGSDSIGDIELDFETRGFVIDLDGDGENIVGPLDLNDRIGNFLPELAGVQQIGCQPAVLGLSPGRDEPVPCYLQIRSGGEWVSPPFWVSNNPISGMIESNGYKGAPIIADIDNDGEMEVAVRGWYHITTLDLDTGTVEKVGTFRDPNGGGDTSGRGYGWWGAINLDGESNPELEIVILGDIEQFISVIGWDNGELKRLWRYNIEVGTSNAQAKHDTGVAPVADVDGDGLPEIVTSIFNKTGDQRWHVMVFDGINGAIECDLVDSYLTGLEDVNGNGAAELFVTATTESVVPEYGDIWIGSCDGDVAIPIWDEQNKGFVSADIPRFPDNVSGDNKKRRLSLFYRSGWTNGRPVFLTKEAVGNGNDIELRVLQFNQGQVAEIASLSGPRLSLESLSSIAPQNGILIKAYAQEPAEGQVSLTNLAGAIQQHGRVDHTDGVGIPGARAGLLSSTVVGRLSAGAMPSIVTQGFGEQLIAMRIKDGLKPTELWRRPGRGMVTQGRSITVPYESVLLADILGTGNLAVISARKGSDGLGEISALDSEGSELWFKSFNVPGDLPPDNEGGITTWIAGHFRNNQYEDVVVSIRIGTSHSSQLHWIDGQTGNREWVQTTGGTCDGSHVTGAGSLHMAVFDWRDGDQLDEILSLRGGSIAVYNGDQEDILLNKKTNDFCSPDLNVFGESWFLESIPVVADFLGDGTEQFLYAANPATLGLLDFNANVLWNTPFYSGLNINSLQGIGDLDGIGGLEIISVGHDDPGKEIYAFNAATGPPERWTLAMPEICDLQEISHVATGDIDGDGRDEALFTVCNVLYAIGENSAGEGEILWRATFLNNRYDANLGEVVIADVDGSGRPQILINTASGYMYGLGAKDRPDVTTFTDVTSDAVPDVATFTGDYAGRPRITVFSGANGNVHTTIDYLNIKWQGLALSTVRDADQDGTADDPAVAMLAVNKTTRKIRVETRDLATGTQLGFTQFLNENWRAIDVVVVDDLNGDGNTNDSAVAVLAERISDGRIQLQLRDLVLGTLISNTVYLNARWTPIAAAVADRSAMSPAGTLPPVIGVIAEKAQDGRRVMQSRVASTGVFDQNIKFLGSAWNYHDISVNHDANSDGILDDPIWLVLATRGSDDVIRVQSKFVTDGSFDDNIVILNANWEGFRLDAANDISGNLSGEMAISAIRRSNGMRRIHIKDYASGATTINIAP